MRETIVTPHTAKVAKIKGFNWDTKLFYDENNKLCECSDEYGYCNNKLTEENTFSYNANARDKFIMSAPTQTHLQKWVRLKYKCDIVIIPLKDSQYICNIYQHAKNGELPPFQVTTLKDDRKPTVFKSYEDALEAGLLFCMKLH